MITLYTAPWCVACTSARSWLESRGVVYTARDVDTDPVAFQFVLGLGQGGKIPVLDVDGETFVGFAPSQYERLIPVSLWTVQPPSLAAVAIVGIPLLLIGGFVLHRLTRRRRR